MQPQTEVKETWLNVDELRIHCLVAGSDGSPVILLHGGGDDSSLASWGRCIGPLSVDHQVYAPDWPGFGKSDKPEVIYSMEYFVCFLERFLDTLHLQQASLVGLSMGGGNVVSFTLQHPGRVDKLVLVDAYTGTLGGVLGNERLAEQLSYLYIHLPFTASVQRIMGINRSLTCRMLAVVSTHPQAIPQEVVDEVYQTARDPRAGEAYASWQKSEWLWHGPRTDLIGRLHEITAPTLIIHGEQDRVLPLSCARRAHACIKHSQLVVLPGCGHWAQVDDPQAFIRIVGQFLQNTTSARTVRDF